MTLLCCDASGITRRYIANRIGFEKFCRPPEKLETSEINLCKKSFSQPVKSLLAWKEVRWYVGAFTFLLWGEFQGMQGLGR
jgi:hypothetical protein